MAVRTIAHSLHLACQVHILTQGNAPRSRLMSKICGGADTCCWEETEDPAEATEDQGKGAKPKQVTSPRRRRP